VQQWDTIRSLFEGLGSGYQRLVVTPDQDEGGLRRVFTLLFEGAHYELSCKHLVVSDGVWFSPRHHWAKGNGIEWMKGRLLEELWSTRYALRSIYWHGTRAKRANYQRREYWVHLLLALLQRLPSWRVKLDLTRLTQILVLAETDARAAYYQLAALFQRSLGYIQDRLQRHLRVLTRLLPIFYGILRGSYSVRNLISSQRSWFLHHGAHPADLLTLSKLGCFLRVCFQPA
jgi:hypothetical protein